MRQKLRVILNGVKNLNAFAYVFRSFSLIRMARRVGMPFYWNMRLARSKCLQLLTNSCDSCKMFK